MSGVYDGGGSGLAVRDSAGIKIIESVGEAPSALSIIVDTVAVLKIGAVDDERYSFSRIIGSVIDRAGQIHVADGVRAEVKLFDARGNYIRTYGGSGSGPGEFQAIRGIDYCNGSVVVSDLLGHRIAIFDDNGKLKETRRWEALRRGVTPMRMTCNETGMFVQIDRESKALEALLGAYTLNAVVASVDQGGNRKGKLIEVPGIDRYRYETVDGPAELGKTASVTTSEDKVVVAVGGFPELRKFTTEGALAEIIRWEYQRLPVTDSVQQAELEKRVEILPAAMRGAYTTLWAQMEHPSHLPSISALRSGPNGEVWVRRYALDHRGSQVWWVIAKSGALLSTVAVPDGFELHTVLEDAVLGVTEDELGVEYVEKRRVIRSAVNM